MEINYREIYKLQDKVFERVFKQNDDLYLTGGTCLNRFYVEKRYSNDLDFFGYRVPNFKLKVRELIIDMEDLGVELLVDAKDFVRIVVSKKLIVDFVNEFTPRLGDIIILENGYRIDNVKNILSNKITAVMGRDNPKDVFDIVLISRYFDFFWGEILKNAKEKMLFDKEDLIYRLKTFPLELLKTIKLTDESFLEGFDKDLEKIIVDIENENYNRGKNEVSN